ncbi:hypothetical protein CRM22_005940 [Opisthorchis felineus]|uniref:Uncharacterized protein n=1 Tax=Opisthorchis felineus TaxID=147828 RepID=A0A4S2LNQ5_OPIFE|nr:hypothetical protein CRM22_005940 [Opisthorchis felineus]
MRRQADTKPFHVKQRVTTHPVVLNSVLPRISLSFVPVLTIDASHFLRHHFSNPFIATITTATAFQFRSLKIFSCYSVLIDAIVLALFVHALRVCCSLGWSYWWITRCCCFCADSRAVCLGRVISVYTATASGILLRCEPAGPWFEPNPGILTAPV